MNKPTFSLGVLLSTFLFAVFVIILGPTNIQAQNPIISPTLSSSAKVANSCYPWSVDLTVDSTGDDVVALQTWLLDNGFAIHVITEGKMPKGYYGNLTTDALKQYQTSVGLPSTGYFGPMTRAKIGESCNSSPKDDKTTRIDQTVKVEQTIKNISTTNSNTIAPLSISSTSATLGSPVMRDKVTVAYPVAFAFTLSAGGKTIYLDNSPENSKSLVFASKDAYPPYIVDMKANPSKVVGDSMRAYAIPANTTRSFQYSGIIYNPNTPINAKLIQISEIRYGTTISALEAYSILRGLEKLKLTAVFSGMNTNTTIVPLSNNSSTKTIIETSTSVKTVSPTPSVSSILSTTNIPPAVNTAVSSTQSTITARLSPISPKERTITTSVNQPTQNVIFGIFQLKSQSGNLSVKSMTFEINPSVPVGISSFKLFDGTKTYIGIVSGNQVIFNNILISLISDIWKDLTFKATVPVGLNGTQMSAVFDGTMYAVNSNNQSVNILIPVIISAAPVHFIFNQATSTATSTLPLNQSPSPSPSLTPVSSSSPSSSPSPSGSPVSYQNDDSLTASIWDAIGEYYRNGGR